MPITTNNSFNDENENDYQFKFALKNMLPIPSNSEQQILLDEYSAQLSQFSISINRIIKEEITDENCVFLLKLLAGMYTLLKTTLLSPPLYRELFVGVCRIEADVHRFIKNWALTTSDSKQEELFKLAWWCESALPRVYLVSLLYSSLPSLWKDPKHLSATFSACKSLQHPLKGSFLYARLHSFLLRIFFNEEQLSEEMKALCSGYSVETFTTLLRFFCRWHHSLPAKTTEAIYTASLFHETFEGVIGQISRMTSYDIFEAILLPTFLVEIVNCGDSLAQTLTFQCIITEFDAQYLYAQLGQIIKSSSQFASGIDLKSLLDCLFRKVQNVRTESGKDVFFETIWEETSKLIKNRSEIDQCDTVIISSLLLNLISSSSIPSSHAQIEKVLGFLIKTLKSIRPEGFNLEFSGVGKEIVELIKNLAEEFDFERILVKLSGLPELLECLKTSSSRKCCLTVLLPKLKEELNDSQLFGDILRLFSCLTRRDLLQLLDGNTIEDVTDDLNEFSKAICRRIPDELIEEFFDAINSSSSCLNLFVIPELLEKIIECGGAVKGGTIYKKLITSFLSNTSTVLPQNVEAKAEWIEPDYPKMMAVKMYLKVIESGTGGEAVDVYELYTEILMILGNNVSQDNLKIQIIDRVLDSLLLHETYNLSKEDFKCLIDHLAKESGQLLRKSDRCKLMLKILELEFNEKYVEQLTNLLNQLPVSSCTEIDGKFSMSCELFESIFKGRSYENNSGNDSKFKEEKLYQWMKEVSEKDSQKSFTFYSIKMKFDSMNNCEDEQENGDKEEAVVDGPLDNDVKIEELTSDDLQKLKIFESFPTEI